MFTEKNKIDKLQVKLVDYGAGSGGRTRTVSLPLDFESSTSANSIIPAKLQIYYSVLP